MSQTCVGPDSGSPAGAPRWVKVFGIIVIVLILAAVILHLTGRRPMSHMPPMQQGAQQP